MNIVEKIKDILTNCALMDDFNNGKHIDYTDKSLVNNYGLYTSGESIAARYINGDKLKIHNFTIYSILDTFDDTDRLSNTSFLINLENYLDKLVTTPFQDGDIWITIKSFSTSNGMLYETLEDKKSIYQFQLKVTYEESEAI